MEVLEENEFANTFYFYKEIAREIEIAGYMKIGFVKEIIKKDLEKSHKIVLKEISLFQEEEEYVDEEEKMRVLTESNRFLIDTGFHVSQLIELDIGFGDCDNELIETIRISESNEISQLIQKAKKIHNLNCEIDLYYQDKLLPKDAIISDYLSDNDMVIVGEIFEAFVDFNTETLIFEINTFNYIEDLIALLQEKSQITNIEFQLYVEKKSLPNDASMRLLEKKNIYDKFSIINAHFKVVFLIDRDDSNCIVTIDSKENIAKLKEEIIDVYGLNRIKAICKNKDYSLQFEDKELLVEILQKNHYEDFFIFHVFCDMIKLKLNYKGKSIQIDSFLEEILNNLIDNFFGEKVKFITYTCKNSKNVALDLKKSLLNNNILFNEEINIIGRPSYILVSKTLDSAERIDELNFEDSVLKLKSIIEEKFYLKTKSQLLQKLEDEKIILEDEKKLGFYDDEFGFEILVTNQNTLVIIWKNKKKKEYKTFHSETTIKELKAFFVEEFEISLMKQFLKDKYDRILMDDKKIEDYEKDKELECYLFEKLKIKVYFEEKLLEDFYLYRGATLLEMKKILKPIIEVEEEFQLWVNKKSKQNLKENEEFDDFEMQEIDVLRFYQIVFTKLNIEYPKTLREDELIKELKNKCFPEEKKQIWLCGENNVLEDNKKINAYSDILQENKYKILIVTETVKQMRFLFFKKSYECSIDVSDRVANKEADLLGIFEELKLSNFILCCKSENGEKEIVKDESWFNNDLKNVTEITIQPISGKYPITSHKDKTKFTIEEFDSHKSVKELKKKIKKEIGLPLKNFVVLKDKKILDDDKTVEKYQNIKNVGFLIDVFESFKINISYENDKKDFDYLIRLPIKEHKIFVKNVFGVEEDKQVWLIKNKNKKDKNNILIELEDNEHLNANDKIILNLKYDIKIMFLDKDYILENVKMIDTIEDLKKRFEKIVSIPQKNWYIGEKSLENKNSLESYIESNNAAKKYVILSKVEGEITINFEKNFGTIQKQPIPIKLQDEIQINYDKLKNIMEELNKVKYLFYYKNQEMDLKKTYLDYKITDNNNDVIEVILKNPLYKIQFFHRDLGEEVFEIEEKGGAKIKKMKKCIENKTNINKDELILFKIGKDQIELNDETELNGYADEKNIGYSIYCYKKLKLKFVLNENKKIDFNFLRDFSIAEQAKFFENKFKIPAENQEWILKSRKKNKKTVGEKKKLDDCEYLNENMKKIIVYQNIELEITFNNKVYSLKKNYNTVFDSIKEEFEKKINYQKEFQKFLYNGIDEIPGNQSIFSYFGKDLMKIPRKIQIKIEIMKKIKLIFKKDFDDKGEIPMFVETNEKVSNIFDSLKDKEELDFVIFNLYFDDKKLKYEDTWDENCIRSDNALVTIKRINSKFLCIFECYDAIFEDNQRKNLRKCEQITDSVETRFTEETIVKEFKDILGKECKINPIQNSYMTEDNIELDDGKKLIDYAKNSNYGYKIFIRKHILKKLIIQDKPTDSAVLLKIPILEQKIFFEKTIGIPFNKQCWQYRLKKLEEFKDDEFIDDIEEKGDFKAIYIKAKNEIILNFNGKISKKEIILSDYKIEGLKRHYEKEIGISKEAQKWLKENCEEYENNEKIEINQEPLKINIIEKVNNSYYGFTNKQNIKLEVFQNLFLEEKKEEINVVDLLKNSIYRNNSTEDFQNKIALILFTYCKKHSISMWDNFIEKIKKHASDQHIEELWKELETDKENESRNRHMNPKDNNEALNRNLINDSQEVHLSFRQFLIHYYVYAAESSCRFYFLKAIRKYYPLPLYLNTWEENFEIENQNLVKEMQYLYTHNFVVVSIGLGNFATQSSGKSEMINKLFYTKFVIAEKKHTICKNIPEIQFDVYNNDTEILAVIDVPSNTKDEIMKEVVKFGNVIVYHTEDMSYVAKFENKFNIKTRDKIILVYKELIEDLKYKNFEENIKKMNKNNELVFTFDKEVIGNKQKFPLIVTTIHEFIFEKMKNQDNLWQYLTQIESLNKETQLVKFLKHFEFKTFKDIIENFKNLIILERKINPTKEESLKLQQNKAERVNWKLSPQISKIFDFIQKNKMESFIFLDILANYLRLNKIKKTGKYTKLYDIKNEIDKNIKEITKENEISKTQELEKNFKQVYDHLKGKVDLKEFPANKNIKEYKEFCLDTLNYFEKKVIIDFTSIELIWREIIYYLEIQLELNKKENLPFYIKTYQEYCLNGYPFEIIDGDLLYMSNTILNEVFKDFNDETIVISVMGPQSSGKSTLLNFLFGCDFSTSSGRCTKGAYGTFIRSNDLKKSPNILIVDTEGLLSIERDESEIRKDFDRKIVLFCLLVSDVVLVNARGDLDEAMKHILNIGVESFLKLRPDKIEQLDHLYVILNQNSDYKLDTHKIYIDKLYEDVNRYLKKSFKLSEEQLKALGQIQVIDQLDKIVERKANAPFCEKVSELCSHIINRKVKNQNVHRKFKTIIEEMHQAWEILMKYSNLVKFENISKKIDEEKFINWFFDSISFITSELLKQYNNIGKNLNIDEINRFHTKMLKLKSQIEDKLNYDFTEYDEDLCNLVRNDLSIKCFDEINTSFKNFFDLELFLKGVDDQDGQIKSKLRKIIYEISKLDNPSEDDKNKKKHDLFDKAFREEMVGYCNRSEKKSEEKKQLFYILKKKYNDAFVRVKDKKEDSFIQTDDLPDKNELFQIDDHLTFPNDFGNLIKTCRINLQIMKNFVEISELKEISLNFETDLYDNLGFCQILENEKYLTIDKKYFYNECIYRNQLKNKFCELDESNNDYKKKMLSLFKEMKEVFQVLQFNISFENFETLFKDTFTNFSQYQNFSNLELKVLDYYQKDKNIVPDVNLEYIENVKMSFSNINNEFIQKNFSDVLNFHNIEFSSKINFFKNIITKLFNWKVLFEKIENEDFRIEHFNQIIKQLTNECGYLNIRLTEKFQNDLKNEILKKDQCSYYDDLFEISENNENFDFENKKFELINAEKILKNIKINDNIENIKDFDKHNLVLIKNSLWNLYSNPQTKHLKNDFICEIKEKLEPFLKNCFNFDKIINSIEKIVLDKFKINNVNDYFKIFSIDIYTEILVEVQKIIKNANNDLQKLSTKLSYDFVGNLHMFVIAIIWREALKFQKEKINQTTKYLFDQKENMKTILNNLTSQDYKARDEENAKRFVKILDKKIKEILFDAEKNQSIKAAKNKLDKNLRKTILGKLDRDYLNRTDQNSVIDYIFHIEKYLKIELESSFQTFCSEAQLDIKNSKVFENIQLIMNHFKNLSDKISDKNKRATNLFKIEPEINDVNKSENIKTQFLFNFIMDWHFKNNVTEYTFENNTVSFDEELKKIENVNAYSEMEEKILKEIVKENNNMKEDKIQIDCLGYFLEALNKELIEYLNKFQVSFEEYELENERDSAVGIICDKKCPCCQRICDQSEMNHKEHKCEFGHLYKGMGGIKLASGDASVVFCDEMKDNDAVLYKSQDKSWKEYKDIVKSNYHFVFPDKIDPDLHSLKEGVKKAWGSFGQSICAKHGINYKPINEKADKEILDKP